MKQRDGLLVNCSPSLYAAWPCTHTHSRQQLKRFARLLLSSMIFRTKEMIDSLKTKVKSRWEEANGIY